MLSKEILEKFKLECELRRLSPRTVKGYYSGALLRGFFCKKQRVRILYPLRAKHSGVRIPLNKNTYPMWCAARWRHATFLSGNSCKRGRKMIKS